MLAEAWWKKLAAFNPQHDTQVDTELLLEGKVLRFVHQFWDSLPLIYDLRAP